MRSDTRVSILLIVFGFATLFTHATVTTHVAGLAALVAGFVALQVAIRIGDPRPSPRRRVAPATAGRRARSGCPPQTLETRSGARPWLPVPGRLGCRAQTLSASGLVGCFDGAVEIALEVFLFDLGLRLFALDVHRLPGCVVGFLGRSGLTGGIECAA